MPSGTFAEVEPRGERLDVAAPSREALAEGAEGVEVGAGVGGPGHAEHPDLDRLPLAAHRRGRRGRHPGVEDAAGGSGPRAPRTRRVDTGVDEGLAVAADPLLLARAAQLGGARVAEVDGDVADAGRAADARPSRRARPRSPSTNWFPAWVSPWIRVCSPSSQISVIRSWCSTYSRQSSSNTGGKSSRELLAALATSLAPNEPRIAGWIHESSSSKRGSFQNRAWRRPSDSIERRPCFSACGSRRLVNVHPEASRSSSTMTYSVGSSPAAAK